VPDIVVLDFKVAGRSISFKMALDKNDPSDTDILNAAAFGKGGYYSTDVTPIIVRAIRSGDRVIDGGANVGFFTLLMAQLVGATGSVIAYEPNPYNCQKIYDNLKLNGYDNVTIFQAPLWAGRTKKTFYACDHNAWGSLHNMPQFGGAETRAIENINTAVLNDIAGPIRLIKLDIEGSEVPALCGAEQHIVNHNCPFIICEMNEFAYKTLQTDQHVMFGLMRSHGYEAFALDPDGSPLHVSRGFFVCPLEGQSKIGIYNVLFSTMENMRSLYD
jgi:FkbM family methyltransferase